LTDAEKIVAHGLTPHVGSELAVVLAQGAVRALAENPTPPMIESGLQAMWKLRPTNAGASRRPWPQEDVDRLVVAFAAMLSAETRE
jgi:hypothetical protein